MSKTKAPTKESSNATLAFTKSIQTITKSQESFEKAVETLNEMINETFGELEMKLKAKQQELDVLEERYLYEEKNKKLQVDLNVKEYAYEAAIGILSENGEIAVSETSYNELKEDYNNLKRSKEEDIRIAVETEHKRNKEHVEILKRTLELQKQAEVAKVQAQLDSQLKHIEVLEDTINRLTKDLDEQRKLTKDVALASAKSGPIYIPQENNRRG